MLQTISTEVPSHAMAGMEENERNTVQSTVQFRLGVHNVLVKMPSWVPRSGWSLHSKGYIIYTSRATRHRIRRGVRLHRYIIEKLLGRPLEEDVHIHHMDNDKGNCCPCNLICLPSCFNPSSATRDPYTGQYLSKEQYLRRYPYNEPDWITSDF